MAKSKKNASKSTKSVKKSTKTSARSVARRRSAAKPKPVLSALEVKRLAKAPSDYEDVLDRFADTMVAMKFRGPITAGKMRSQKNKAASLEKKANALELKFIAADRARMGGQSIAYKSMLSNWRSVQARMPDDAALAEAFQFMVEWMATNKVADDGGDGGGTGAGGTGGGTP